MIERPDLRLELATENDIPAHYSILALCGEHMHRAQGMSHWYPFPDVDAIRRMAKDRNTYAVLNGNLLVGTMNLATIPLPYDDGSQWDDASLSAYYFGGFGVLPSHWGQGIGTWCMAQVDQLTQAAGFDRVRFDAVESNTKVNLFYERLGYIKQGVLAVGAQRVVCYEKVFT